MSDNPINETLHDGPLWVRESAWGGALLAAVAAAAVAALGNVVGVVFVGVAVALWIARQLVRASRFEIETTIATEESARLREGREELEEEMQVLHDQAGRLELLRQRAEMANLSKGAFLASMSHEIRTPMNGILGMGRLLSETELTREQKDFTATILDSAESLLVLLNDILDLSKIEAGKLELEDVDFDLPNCLERAVNLLLPKAAEKGLEIACAIDPEVPQKVRGDSARLRQIVINLVSNAIKFTDDGEVELRVELNECNDETLMLRIEVRDTGPGIADDRMAAVFAPFTQEDTSTTRRYGGTGLGLAISRQLAETMGGDMGVEPAEGGGSLFWFTAELKRRPDETAASSADWSALNGLQVLLVDDNDTSRAIVRECLDRWGVECVDVATREDALRSLKARAQSGGCFDVALIDSDLDDGDGIELAQAILQDHAFEPPDLVLLKSFRCQYRANRLTRIGFDAWVSKPVWPRALREALLHLRDVAEQVEVRDALKRAPASAADTDALEEDDSFELDVLLVEDNVVNQKVATLLLKKLGCSIDVAANGLQAVEATRAKRYDVVFMDCQMPVMNGFDATHSIRDGETHEHLPIIAMTANAMEEDRRRCLDAGMDDYLSKPVNLERLQSVLERWAGTVSAAPPDEGPIVMTTTPDNPTQEVLSQEVLDSLRELSDGSTELLAELVDLFVEDTPSRLEALQAALASGDAVALEGAAHGLKSSCANIGALIMSDMCRELETLGRENRLDEAGELVQRSTSEFARVQSALAKELKA